MTKIVSDRAVELETRVEIDPDLHAVVEFMQGHVAANRLVGVAGGLAALAPVLWGKYQPETVQALTLVSEPIAEPQTREVSSE